MQFQVFGANRETGRNMSVIIDAATPSEAEQLANRTGMLIERIEPYAPVAVPVRRPLPCYNAEWTKWAAFILGLPALIAGMVYVSRDTDAERTYGGILIKWSVVGMCVFIPLYVVLSLLIPPSYTFNMRM